MNIEEPLRAMSCALVAPGGPGYAVGSGRWHVLFSGRERPLLMPADRYALQKQCLRYFVADGVKALYAKTMLKANALLPAAGLLPEFRLPRGVGPALPCALTTGTPSHAAIQIGTPGPYQKASILLVSEGGEALALVKLALVPSADRMVSGEAAWLRALAEHASLSGQVPRLLAEDTAPSGRRYLVATPTPSTELTSALTRAHTRFLKALGQTRLQVLRFTASPCFASLEAMLAGLEQVVSRDVYAALGAALEDCRAALADWYGPFVMAQGDFAPWNIRVHGEQLFVFDWEYASEGANPLGDVFNYFMIQRAVTSRLNNRSFLTAMRRAADTACEFYPQWAWRPRVVGAFALAYLIEVVLCYSKANGRLQREHPVMRSYWELMERRHEWLAAC